MLAACGTGPLGNETLAGAAGWSGSRGRSDSRRDGLVAAKFGGGGASRAGSNALGRVPGGALVPTRGAGAGCAAGGLGSGAPADSFNRCPHSRQKLASVGLSTPQWGQSTRSGGAAGPLPSSRAFCSTEPQSRQYLTWPGLLRPQREHSTHAGDREESRESSPSARNSATMYETGRMPASSRWCHPVLLFSRLTRAEPSA